MLEPFIEYSFMQRALLGSLIMCLGAVPVGVFMTLKRLSLTGDAMSHAILPGAAIAYLVSGLSLLSLTIGGLIAGFIVVVFAGWVARSTHMKEDTSLAAFYLISLSLGVLILSINKSNIDLFHILFGNIFGLDNDALLLLASICSISLFIFAFLYRPLVIDCVDPSFIRRSGFISVLAHYGFLILMVINLVAGFHALGTLMAIGMMILPAAAARFWVKTLDRLLLLSIFFSFIGCFIGLLASYHLDLPAGPSIVLTVGSIYIISLFIGLEGGFATTHFSKHHQKG